MGKFFDEEEHEGDREGEEDPEENQTLY
jgi:hypothetical protein